MNENLFSFSAISGQGEQPKGRVKIFSHFSLQALA